MVSYPQIHSFTTELSPIGCEIHVIKDRLSAAAAAFHSGRRVSGVDSHRPSWPSLGTVNLSTELQLLHTLSACDGCLHTEAIRAAAKSEQS